MVLNTDRSKSVGPELHELVPHGERQRASVRPSTGGHRRRVPCRQQASQSGSFPLRTDMKAFWLISTLPIAFIRFLPAFCFSSSFRFRVMSPP